MTIGDFMAEPIFYINEKEVKNNDLATAGKCDIRVFVGTSKIKSFSVNDSSTTNKSWSGEIVAGKLLLKVVVKLNLIGTKTKTYTCTLDVLNPIAKTNFEVISSFCNFQATKKAPELLYRGFSRLTHITNQFWGWWPFNRNGAVDVDTKPLTMYQFLDASERQKLSTNNIKTLRELVNSNVASTDWAQSIITRVTSALGTTREKECRKALEWAHYNHEYVFIDLEYYWAQLGGKDSNGQQWWYGGVGEYTDAKLQLFRDKAQECVQRIQWIKAQSGMQNGLDLSHLKYICYVPSRIWDNVTPQAKDTWKKLMFDNFIKPISEHVDFIGVELYLNNVHQPTPDAHIKNAEDNLDIYKTLSKPLFPIVYASVTGLTTAHRLIDLIKNKGCVGYIWWENPTQEWNEEMAAIARMIKEYDYRDFN